MDKQFEKAEFVSATLEYLESFHGKPTVNILAMPGADPPASSYTAVSLPIYNGRGKAGSFSLDREGFQLCSAPTGMQSFETREDIHRVYYPEMEELGKAVTGASHAIVFDHLVRRRALDAATPFGTRAGHRPGAAMRVHCDFTPSSAQRRLRMEMEARNITHAGRFAIINLWRTTRLPVLDAPLAVCDSRTVRSADLIATDIVYPTRTGEIFEVLYNPDHAWTFFDAMQFDEVLIFKQYDSADGMARYTPHSAFIDANTPPGTPPRESVEIRCLLMFD